jgi:ribosome biogenesis GTPase
MAKKNKTRTDFRKHHESRTRRKDLTRDYLRERLDQDAAVPEERISGKGELTRRRTVITDDNTGLAVDAAGTLRGRVLRVFGLASEVETEEGRLFRCATRRLLKNLATDERHVVAAGDLVYIRPEGKEEGFIERVEPRTSELARTSKNRRHVIVANVDQIFIVASAAEPHLKPNLIDRYLVAAEQMRIRPVIVINKIDLVDAADLQPLAGVYGQMGYDVLLVSATTGQNIARLRSMLPGRESVFTGQSGVGKSSLLNAIEPGLDLRVNAVSAENQKGKHTTTTAHLLKLQIGGYVVDTPGIRQFQLWDIIPREVAGLYRDLRPYVSLCRFPDCTHTHEADCAVKAAVGDGRLDARRYESYCSLFEGDEV